MFAWNMVLRRYILLSIVTSIKFQEGNEERLSNSKTTQDHQHESQNSILEVVLATVLLDKPKSKFSA